ncbi:MAG: hypothetical protein U0K27_03385, partial [Segatella copri]|nr:hypothetical protein [Segatella copri]
IILGITRLQIKWMNRRYEKSRWLIFAAMMGLALQFLAQMGGNFGRKATMREPSVIILLLLIIAMPVAVLSTDFLYVIGPMELLAMLFFIISFVSLGYNYPSSG